MRHNQDAAVAAATVADDARSALLADLLGRVAGCFPRRETRQCCAQMVNGLLMELEDHNCWTIAEAVGHRGPQEDHQLSKQAVGLDSGQVIRWRSWHRWTAVCLLAYIYLAVAVARQRQDDAGSDLDAGLIPVTIPELLRLLRDTVIPRPRRDRAHRLHWSTWRRRHQHRARKPTGAGMLTQRQRRTCRPDPDHPGPLDMQDVRRDQRATAEIGRRGRQRWPRPPGSSPGCDLRRSRYA